jgi:tetratricopeptide (TPR) repeat protein
VKELSLAMQKENPQSWEALYHLGMFHSYTAYYKFRDGGSWIGGLQHGLKATGFLEDCLARNPAAYDAYTGIGTYKYWKSRRMSFLTWTPFVSDEREAGIKMLREAEQKATYTASQATNSLVWIFIEEERYAEAEAAARQELKKYPANRLFLWGLASAAEKAGRWSSAREAYQAIVRSIDHEVAEKRYIEIQARSKIAKMSVAMGDAATAKREADWVIANGNFDTSGFTSDGAERIERRVREAAEIRESLK